MITQQDLVEKLTYKQCDKEIKRIKYLLDNYKFSSDELKYTTGYLKVLEKRLNALASKKDAREANI